jgi:hypothetical protein
MKNSTGGQAGLKSAVLAVKKSSIFQIPRIYVPTFGAYKTAFPSLFKEVLLARLIVRKCFLKFYQIILVIFPGHTVTWPENMPENGLGVKCIGIYFYIISFCGI